MAIGRQTTVAKAESLVKGLENQTGLKLKLERIKTLEGKIEYDVREDKGIWTLGRLLASGSLADVIKALKGLNNLAWLMFEEQKRQQELAKSQMGVTA